MDDYDQDVESAWQNHAYAEPYPTAVLQFTTKIAPSFDGRVSWFSYEEAIDEWSDIKAVFLKMLLLNVKRSNTRLEGVIFLTVALCHKARGVK